MGLAPKGLVWGQAPSTAEVQRLYSHSAAPSEGSAAGGPAFASAGAGCTAALVFVVPLAGGAHTALQKALTSTASVQDVHKP